MKTLVRSYVAVNSTDVIKGASAHYYVPAKEYEVVRPNRVLCIAIQTLALVALVAAVVVVVVVVL